MDLESAEARQFAPLLLPATAVFGRASKLRSHWLYRSDVSSSLVIRDPIGRHNARDSLLVELRAEGQTVFPGSIHPAGEPVEWAGNWEPLEVDGDDLVRRVRTLAVLSVLKRHWTVGQADDNAVLAVIDLLAHAKMQSDSIASFLEAVIGRRQYSRYLDMARNDAPRSSLRQLARNIASLEVLLGKLVTDWILRLLDDPA